MAAASRTLLLITASSPEIREVRRSRVLNFQQITMPYLASFVPPHWTVLHIDEAVSPVDFSAQPDLVAITFHTPSAPHVYAFADRCRQMGITVVLGGPHVTLMPDEAQTHADVIFVGEAESHWPQFFSDFEAGCHRTRYHAAEPPTLEMAPKSRKDLFCRRDHAGGVLFATRGCANRCDFCTLAVMYRSCVRKRPVEAVAEEFGSFRGKVIILWDDNIAGDMEYAKALFRALAHHRKWWSSQASIHAARDDEFLRLAAQSGCKQLFVGLESISQASVDEVRKGFNRVTEYKWAIERIHSYGIAVQAGIIFGFDNDSKTIFSETLDFLEETGVQNATFNMLTPFPGTRLYARLEEEGRILTRDWSRYNGRADVVYQPRQMSPEELLAGYQYANSRFYSWTSVYRRLTRSPVQLFWTLPLNVAYGIALRHY
ncbi:MAG TPA: radical SAM protein [Thermodesulfovibrionales bacterium]|nr:radical SAM protein [Thermodesulfovibrionales bacterium]